jgi:hypothetical protein
VRLALHIFSAAGRAALSVAAKASWVKGEESLETGAESEESPITTMSNPGANHDPV